MEQKLLELLIEHEKENWGHGYCELSIKNGAARILGVSSQKVTALIKRLKTAGHSIWREKNSDNEVMICYEPSTTVTTDEIAYKDVIENLAYVTKNSIHNDLFNTDDVEQYAECVLDKMGVHCDSEDETIIFGLWLECHPHELKAIILNVVN